MNAKEFAQIAAAFAEDPASVQVRDRNEWMAMTKNHVIRSDNEYRLTPKPREWWLVLDRDGDCACTTKSLDAAEDVAYRRQSGCYSPYSVVPVVELMP